MTTAETERRANALALANAMQPIHEAYFKMVAPANDWRARIDALVPVGVSLDALRDAVVHFTATEPSFELRAGNVYRVTAVGYRAGPAGP